MKVLFLTHNFIHPWHQVTTANFQKYPNPMTPQVIHVDVLSRHHTNGTLKTERIIACKQPVPSFIKFIFNIKEDYQYVYELSEVNALNKTYNAYSCNLTFSEFVKLKERVCYEHDFSTNGTVLKQTAVIDVFKMGEFIKRRVEEFCGEKFVFNAENGRKGLEFVVGKLFGSNDDVDDDVGSREEVVG